MIEMILNHFALIGREGEETLSVEEIEAWPPGDVAGLKRLMVVKKATPAKVIACPGCEEACLMTVHVYPAQDDRALRIFISCDKREDTGRILIDPAELEQWQIDVGRFVSLLAAALGTGHAPDEIIPQQTFYLGALTINRKRRSAIFVCNNEVLNASIESDLFHLYPHPFFLVAAGLPRPQEMKQGPAIPLLHMLLPSEKGLFVDLDELKEALSNKSNMRQDVIPVQVPVGTDWKQVFISFVNDQTVQIRVAGKTEHRSFDEMGFNDARKTESQPSALWGVFHQISIMNGEMTLQDSVKSFSDPEKVKKWVSQIRKKLQQVFPTISGDPFHPYTHAKGYKTRFVLNIYSPSM
jgi:hypothetical protein